MSRTKQFNVTVPKKCLATLAQFDDLCQELHLSRSELVLELMTQYVADHEVTPPTWQQELAAGVPLSEAVKRSQEAGEENSLPQFLR